MKKNAVLIAILCFLSVSAAYASDIPAVEEIIKNLMPQEPAKSRGLIRGVGGVQTSDENPQITLHLQFEMDSAKLRDEDIPPLQNLGKAMQDAALTAYIYKIEGHTCDLGSSQYNRDLSRRRAQAVRDFLVRNFGMSPRQFETAGYGEMQPLVPNTDETARQQNRRVVIKNTLQKTALSRPVQEKVAVELKCIRNFQEEVVKDGDRLTQENGYALEFITRQNLHVYIYQSDSAGKLTLLFPSPRFSAVKNPVKGGILYRIPEQGKILRLDQNAGREDIIVFAAERVLTEPDEICKGILGNPLAPSEGVMVAEASDRGFKIIIKDEPGVAGVAADPQSLNSPKKTQRPPVSKKSGNDLFVWKRYFIHE